MDIDQIPCHKARFVDQNGVSRTLKVPVAQELARRRVDFLPEQFIRTLPGDFIPSFPIPVIDMSKIQTEEELGKLAQAAKEWGMFLVKNHGVGSDVLSDVKTVVKGFFGLSFEEKKASVGSYDNVDNMGYGRNFVRSENQCLDWLDRLTMKANPKVSTDGLSAWPRYPPNFRPLMEKYIESARKLCDNVFQALAESISADRDVFLKHFDDKSSELYVRVNYYPPCPRPDMTLGLQPHTDGSALTVLVQFDNSGGLQLYKDGRWIAVEWPVDELLVNVGDFTEIMSNGRFESSWHRAGAQKDAERFSVALFYNRRRKLRSSLSTMVVCIRKFRWEIISSICTRSPQLRLKRASSLLSCNFKI